MIYKAIKSHPQLTINKIYTEYFPYPDGFYAAVTTDNGEVMHVPRNEFLEVIEENEAP